MRPSRARLINAARRSMLQRGALARTLGTAREAFKPRALVGRAKYRIDEKVDDTAYRVREKVRRNRVPIALAALAGTAWLLREPISTHAPRIGRRLRDLADGAIARFRPADEPAAMADPEIELEDDDDEAHR